MLETQQNNYYNTRYRISPTHTQQQKKKKKINWNCFFDLFTFETEIFDLLCFKILYFVFNAFRGSTDNL